MPGGDSKSLKIFSRIIVGTLSTLMLQSSISSEDNDDEAVVGHEARRRLRKIDVFNAEKAFAILLARDGFHEPILEL